MNSAILALFVVMPIRPHGLFIFIAMEPTTQYYESEFEKFLNEFKRQHPDIVSKQREARAIWWDKPLPSPEEMESASMSEVKWKSYSYD